MSNYRLVFNGIEGQSRCLFCLQPMQSVLHLQVGTVDFNAFSKKTKRNKQEQEQQRKTTHTHTNTTKNNNKKTR